MMKQPCRDCQDRHATCHSTCPKYVEWRKAFDAEKAAQRKYKQEEWDRLNYQISRLKR